MTEASVVWFIDVDGVLNACPWAAERRGVVMPEPAWPDMRVTSSRTHASQKQPYTITYSPTLISLIRELHESKLVDVRWLTTWGNAANSHLRYVIGLPELKLAGKHPTKQEMRLADRRNVWWKSSVALNAIQELDVNTRIIWTDDHLTHVPKLCDALTSAGVLTIAPDELLGLTPSDMDRIVSYVETGAIEAVA